MDSQNYPISIDEKKFIGLLDKSKYQVFLFACPASLPFSLSTHPWFVINRMGHVSRWEIFWRPQKGWRERWGHLHKDFYNPLQGTPFFFFSEKFLWKRIRLLGCIEGETGSLAERMTEFIMSSPKKYPYCHEYSIIGPNSNTYVQWVLNNFPEFGIKLPWNSFGKNYKIRELAAA